MSGIRINRFLYHTANKMIIVVIILLVIRVVISCIFPDIALLDPQYIDQIKLPVIPQILSFFVFIKKIIDIAINNDAMIRINTALGLINFSLSYYITARKSSINSIPLSSVIAKLFPWSSKVYIQYAFFIITGIYCGAMNIMLLGVFCMLGMIIALISALYLAFLFAFNHEKTVMMTEYYLMEIMPDEKKDNLSQCGTYINSYYKDRNDIPSDLIGPILKTLELDNSKTYFQYDKTDGISYYLYLLSEYYSKSENEPAEDKLFIRNVFLARSLNDNIFSQMDKWEQANLLKQLLIKCADIVYKKDNNTKEKEADNQETIDKEAESKEIEEKEAELFNIETICKEGINSIHILLIGLIASLRYSQNRIKENKAVSDIWKDIFSIIMYSDIQAPFETENDRLLKFKKIFKLLIIMMESTALVEMSIQYLIEQPERKIDSLFFDRFEAILERYNINRNDPISFFSIGQVILAAAGQPDYNSEKACITSYEFIKWARILYQSNSEETEICQL